MDNPFNTPASMGGEGPSAMLMVLSNIIVSMAHKPELTTSERRLYEQALSTMTYLFFMTEHEMRTMWGKENTDGETT